MRVRYARLTISAIERRFGNASAGPPPERYGKPRRRSHQPAARRPQFRHYQILARLGAGGHGEVYEGWDSRLRRKVAIKRHRALDPLRDPASLVKEARMTASLHHPAFAQIYSIEQDDEGWAIVMELIAGQTWRQLAQDKEHPLDLPTVLGWMVQLAEAMEAAHQSGLITAT